MREDLLQWLRAYTHNPNLEDINGVSVILDKLEEWEQQKSGVTSKSVSRYSISYSEDIPQSLKTLISAYKRVGMM